MEVGTGENREKTIELSQLIEILNERLGTDFKPADQLFFDSIKEDAVADSHLRQVALANPMEGFAHVFLKRLEDLFIDRMEQNEEIAAKFMNEKKFRDAVEGHLTKQVYDHFQENRPHPTENP